MRANEAAQVGGTHYRGTEYQHWDLVVAVGMGYLEGCTTKYVCRWRKKGGIEDLRKALHYLNKLQEVCSDRVLPSSFEAIVKEVARFNEANNLPDLERAYMAALTTWQTKMELEEAREIVFFLIDEAEARLKVEPVPLTEENKHSERIKG